MMFVFVEYQYIRRETTDCITGYDLFVLSGDSASDNEHCKQWCADNNDCGGFTVWSGDCFFKNQNCAADLHPQPGSTVYLKLLK